uniref:LRAT domain-containing protein n=1 Tax=Oryzias latipes TaxID=8090 RepID=A0A3P9IMV2_ORYLA
MSKMKTLLVFALAVHKFGDIVSIPRKCLMKRGPTCSRKFRRKKYTGNDFLIPFFINSVEISCCSTKPQCLVFTKNSPKFFCFFLNVRFYIKPGKNRGGGIIFGNLAVEGAYKVENYLDDLKNLCINISKAAIKERIHVVLDTGDYHLLKNNCEHAATFMRYGVSYSNQVHVKSVSIYCSAICQPSSTSP